MDYDFLIEGWFDEDLVTDGGPATQTLLPSLLTNTTTFFAATVVAGAVSLAPTLLTNTEQFFTPTVSLGGETQTLTPSLVTNTESFYAATVAPGQVILAAPLSTNASALYTPVVAPGAVSLAPSLLSNTDTLYAPSVFPGTVTLASGLSTNSSTLYAPTVLPGAVQLTPTPFTNSDALYAPVVTLSGGTQVLLPSLLDNAQTFYGAAVSGGAVVLYPPLLGSSESVYAPAVSVGAVTLAAPLVTNAATIYSALITQIITFEDYFPPDYIEPGYIGFAGFNQNTFFSPAITVGQVNAEPTLFVNDQLFPAATVVVEGEQDTRFGGWWPAHPYAHKQTKTRKERDSERQALGILPIAVEGEAPAAQPVVVTRTYQRATEKLLRQLPKAPTRVVVPTYNLPTASAEPTMAPDVSALVVDPALVATQRKRAFEQDLVYIVAALLS